MNVGVWVGCLSPRMLQRCSNGSSFMTHESRKGHVFFLVPRVDWKCRLAFKAHATILALAIPLFVFKIFIARTLLSLPRCLLCSFTHAYLYASPQGRIIDVSAGLSKGSTITCVNKKSRADFETLLETCGRSKWQRVEAPPPHTKVRLGWGC